MKVAQALAQVKDLKGKINSVQNRINMDSMFKKVTPDQKVPSIEPLLDELVRLNNELRSLKVRIAKTNVKHGLTERIHEMEMLRYIVGALDSLARAKQEVTNLERIDYDGPAQAFTTYATYNVEELNMGLDENRARIRELDMELQQLNWSTDLEE